MYVSRGIGTSLMPVRIGATPELAIFDWSLL
jgi:predicted MPP superfamily phosphohydrolase